MQKEWLTEKDKILIPFNSKKLTLTAVEVLGVGHKPYHNTALRTRFLDEFGKNVLDGEKNWKDYLPFLFFCKWGRDSNIKFTGRLLVFFF